MSACAFESDSSRHGCEQIARINAMVEHNPYIGRGQPVSGERLVGRKELLEKLVNRIEHRAHCSIVGLRRIGKTSLAREAVRKAMALPSSSHSSSVYISLDAVGSPIGAYSRIIKDIEDSTDYIDIQHSNHDECYDQFCQVLRGRCKNGKKSIVVVDEFDAIIHSKFPDSQLFVARLREIANDQERYGITFVFISRRQLSQIQGEIDYSTLAGLCETFHIKPFDRNSLGCLMKRSLLKIDDSAKEHLWYFTGGHPYLAEVVMCEVMNQQNSRITEECIKAAQNAQLNEFMEQYKELKKFLDDHGMFEPLCELVVGPFWRTIDPDTTSRLRGYGLLRNDDVHDSNYRCMSEHFRDYLTMLNRATPTWVLLGNAERQLRNLVRDCMTQEYGDKWFDELQTRRPIMAGLLEKQLREKRQFGDAASNFVLDYAYFGELSDVVIGDWNIYRGTLGEDRTYWEEEFKAVVRVRNPLAHHREVPPEDLRRATDACNNFLARLSRLRG